MTDRSPRRPLPWLVLAVVLTLAGVVALVIAGTGQQDAPQPARADARTEPPAPTSQESPGPPAGNPDAEADTQADVALPVSVAVPAIGVTSDLLALGLNADGTVEVPPLTADDQAGWYERGPAPGAVGPAVVLGHVDSAEHGPGVFFDLGALQPGDEITVTRADGTVAVFAVDRVERHPKDDFPTIEVYGDTDDAELRLITCGGDFDSTARSYEDNVVVFASLVGTRGA
jgi:sortase (surface protein transpeptidase)